MKYPKYLYKSEELFLVYQFTSEGSKGQIKKVVEYTKTTTTNVYNLGFGDYNETTNSINDLLATVASTILAFTKEYPNAWIIATGSTKGRTRLYRIGIANNLTELSKDFIIFGYNKDESWEEFSLGKDYEAFLLTKKENYFEI
jgi:hypothetical protein